MERTVSLTCVAAIGMWALTFVLIFSGSTLAVVSEGRHLAIVLTLMAHGLACSAAAATFSIRTMFRKQNRLVREVFELGRDSGEAAVRRMR